MKGRTLEEARAQMLGKGMAPAEVDEIAPHRVFSGDRPSITILYRKLDPHTLGRLIALYEHRVFVEAQLFGINAFDQWGVELGKELATGLQPVIEGKEPAGSRDASTAGLVAHIHGLRKGRLILADIKGILFDKDGTLVDFQATWFAIGDGHGAGGGRRRREGGARTAGRAPATISPRAASRPIPSLPPAPMPTSSRSGIRTPQPTSARR